MASHHETPRSVDKILLEITEKYEFTKKRGNQKTKYEPVRKPKFLAGKPADASHFGDPGNLGFKSHKGQKVRPLACTELLLSFLSIKLRPLKHCTKHKRRADWGGGTCSLAQETSLPILTGVWVKKKKVHLEKL